MEVLDWGDRLDWKVDTKVEKWHDQGNYLAGDPPDEVFEDKGNLLLNAGITRMINLLTGAGGTAFNAANSRIGVGNSTTAAAAGQTDLQGGSKYFKLVDSATPSGQTVTWVATFASGDANFAWEEWGIDNGSTSGSTVTAPLLNRKVAAMGTKGSGSTWTLTVTITIS
jgi:hypothetical protein